MVVLRTCTNPIDGFHDRVHFTMPESFHVLLSINNRLGEDPHACRKSCSNLASFISIDPARSIRNPQRRVKIPPFVWIEREKRNFAMLPGCAGLAGCLDAQVSGWSLVRPGCSGARMPGLLLSSSSSLLFVV